MLGIRIVAGALAVGVVGLVLVTDEREALACGGCFHEAPTPAKPIVETSLVSDHRMVFALAPEETILWDQIRYTGNPSEFAWVLPVKPGTTIELSHDEWIAALDLVSDPQIIQPTPQPASYAGGGGYGGDVAENGGGCGSCLGSADNASFAEGASADASASADAGPPAVQVVSQEVVGPYETVIVRSDKPKALETWLQDHGYAVPDSMLPVITAYTAQHLDFVALRLRPGQGVRAMRPVRIVSPGADPTLPLRMVAAGIGAHVGLTLFVLSEGRYRPQNFPEAQIDETKLFWSFAQSRSNYQELSIAVMAQNGNRTWLTEYAGQPVTDQAFSYSNVPGLYNAYYGTCLGRSAPPPTVIDAGTDDASTDDGGLDAGVADEPDASDPDASAPDDDGGTASADAGSDLPPVSIPTAVCTSPNDLCCQFDDLETVLSTMHRRDVWLTRLRADLPSSALSTDLLLEAHPSQVPVDNVHTALTPSGTTASIAPSRNPRLGTGIILLGTALLLGRMVRRRRRVDS